MHPKKAYFIFMYLCGTSLFFIVAGIVLLCMWGSLYDYIIRSNLILKPNSTAYSVWVKNPVPLSLKLFVFNWTNPKDIYDNNTKPKFQQLGPYYFSETKEKSSVIWNDNGTVTYKNLKKWYFEASLSNGSLTDTVTSIDPVALSAVYTTRSWNYFVKKSLSGVLLSMIDSVSISHTVGQVLYEGYDDPLLKTASTISSFHASLPKMEKFGWFYGRNGSEDSEGSFNIDTGVSGRTGQLYNWRYSNHTTYNPGSCGALENTSGGDFFPTDLKKDSIIKFFSPDMCRYVELEFEREVVIHGIVGYKYAAFDKFLDNGTKVPENRCFCDGDCMPYGLLNISACRYGSPAFVSLPNFYKADPYYLQNVEGLTPEKEKNDFFMIFEPKTGIPLQVAARLQLNLRLQSVKGYSLYQGVPTVYFPVLWFEQVVAIPENMTFTIKLLLNFKVICWAISIISIIVGILVQICMCYKLCTMNLFGRKKSKKANSKSAEPEIVPLKENST
ncbi:protein peste-like isoform X2 [Anoplophora glabripennis]|nr:protein peste-like isoform X2 [Anoplophora glabripennis]